jgi:arylformamidase
MNFMAFCLAAIVCWFTQSLAATRSLVASVPAQRPGPTLIKNIAYASATADARRSFDLYLPAKSNAKPPLLIFVHGGFWLLPDEEYRIGPSLAENLVKHGVVVAQAQDVASAVARLAKDADKYGFAAKRIFLSGHSAGGYLASLIALDKSYLAERKLTGNTVAGVISFSGLYDLVPTWNISGNQKVATEKTFGNDPAVLKRASPVHYARADAPRFLIINAAADFRGFALDARRFADALRSAGAKEIHRHIFKGADHFSIVKLDDKKNAVRRTMLGFMGVKGLPE